MVGVSGGKDMKVVVKDELRRYMGPKYARVPRGAIVRLVGS